MVEPSELRKAERYLRRADPDIGAVISKVGRCRLDEAQQPTSFAALARTIVFQQLSGKAANTIYKRVLATLGRRYPNPESILRASHDDLRAAGLSRQKTTYIRDLAAKVADGSVSLRRLRFRDDEEVIAELTKVKGIGRWTAEIYLMFNLGRLDVLPVDDLGIRSGARNLYGLEDLPDAATLRSIGEPWRPYRSVASWYLWRSLDAE